MAFLGMRGSGDWGPNAVPQNWREMIMYLYPNGQVPLTAMLSMMGSEKVNNPTFRWWEQGMPVQGGDLTNVFSDSDLSTAYTSGATAGSILWAQMAQATAEEFRVGHQAQFEKKGDPRLEVQGLVVARMLDGADSKVAVKLIEADKTVDADSAIENCDYLAVIGNANPEGATMPDSIMYEPVEFSNNTQIFRTPLSITRTAKRTRIRYGSEAYQLAKRQALELHALEMEKAFLWGQQSTQIGSNGKPLRTTRGLINAIREHSPTNIVDYRTDTDFTGLTWTQGGEQWLNKVLGDAFTFGDVSRLGVHGPGAGRGIQELVMAGSVFNITSSTEDYGVRVNRWLTAQGEVNLKHHPLFAHNVGYTNVMLLFEPKRLQFAYIDDTFFVSDPEDKRNRNNSKDATEEEYITEGGLMYNHVAKTAHLLAGVGLDNTLS